MSRCLVLAGLLLVASCAPANSAGVQGKRKKMDWMFLLPVKVNAPVDDETSSAVSLLARATVIQGFDERNIPIISPVQMQVTERDLHVNLSQDGGWTVDLFNKLNDRWSMRYVGTVIVEEVTSKEGLVEVPPGTPPPPGGTLTTTVKLVASLYDFNTRKFVFENKEQLTVLKVGRPGPMDEQIVQERNRAVQQAVRDVFKGFLSKLPKKPPSVGVKAGGG